MTDTAQGSAAATLARTKRIEIQHFADGGSVRRTTVKNFGKPSGAAAAMAQMPPSHAGAKTMEHGGAIHGPGTPTSDSVPIWASKDEFMLPADTAAAVGKGNLQALVDATHTPTRSPAEKMGRIARADGGLVDPGAVTRIGNSYSGGNVSGDISVNGQAPAGTTSTVDAFRAPPPPAAAVAPVAPVAPKPAVLPMATMPGAAAAVPAPAPAPPPPAPLDYANRNAAFNAGADTRTAMMSTPGVRRSNLSAAPTAGTAAATLAARPVQSIVGYADGGVIDDLRNPMARLPAVQPAMVVPPAGTADVIGRRPPINMGMADVVPPAQLPPPQSPSAVPARTAGNAAAPIAPPQPSSEVIGRRPTINMGPADVVQPARLPPQAAPAALGGPAAAAPAVSAASKLASFAAPAGAVAGIAGAAQSIDDLSNGRRDAFINSVGADPASVPQTVAADAARVLSNVGDAATFGLAGRLGRGIAESTGGGSFVDGFVGNGQAPVALSSSSGRGANEIPTGNAPVAPSTPPAAPAASQADVRRVDNGIDAASSATEATAPPSGSYQPAGSMGFVAGGVSAAERLAQLNRDVAFEKDKQTWRNPSDPTPGVTIIDNAASEADRRAQFNEQANLGNALARTTWSPRKGTQVNDAAVAAAMAPIDARSRMAQMTAKEAGDTQRAQIAERGTAARARMADTRQQQELGISKQRLALDGERLTLDTARGDRQELAAQTDQARKARSAQLDDLILNGTPEQQKAAAAQKGALMGKGLDEAAKTGEVSTNIRKEFEGLPEVKNYKQALPSYRGIEDAVKRSTPMSDINVVYGIAKLYDPNSVVREGEYATVANAPGMPERVKGWVQYVAGGGKLTDQVKNQILTEAKSRMTTFDTEYGAARDRYSEIARKSSADPTLVVPQDWKPAVAAPAAAAPALPPRESLVAGKSYQTARGAAVWDGKQFTTPN